MRRLKSVDTNNIRRLKPAATKFLDYTHVVAFFVPQRTQFLVNTTILYFHTPAILYLQKEHLPSFILFSKTSKCIL